MNSVNLNYASNPPQQGISARVILKNFTFPVGVFRRNVTGNKVTLAPVRGALWAGVFRVVHWCAMYLVHRCTLIGSLAIQTYSLTRLPFVLKIISVNGCESVGSVVQKCRSTWQDLFNRYACACCVMSNGPQDPLGIERWVIMSPKGTTSACSADITSERTRRAATNHGPSQEKGKVQRVMGA